ncbi:DNA-directed RNA polymerase subunit B [archaeon]|jgi:DNA-directed RNA polymerase subunit B'|nr:DNA-directed RNA polymerase subunit B [archaeon]MBT4021858.1 DNA-directed RNA polymerase subunit B [archaeon]MBT4272153.1 DNA-directed RNA polymerase subunit B [archaeon]MBT4460334.1 DNA-directed RNA polymerase subunit B [archaeon]MBT4858958.1 DNA-directed RNA polymerase subunit B [archaeon]
MSEVILNGKFIGNVENPQKLVDSFQEERRKGKIHYSINIYQDKVLNQVMIESSKGRAIRPLIVVKDGKSLLTDKHLEQIQKNELTFSDLVNQGVIEYLDAMEEEAALVSFNEKGITLNHTHMEILPLAIVGLCTSLVPFGNFNQSTRLNAGSKNQKQALGLYTANYLVRMDMDVNILQTPQIPVVKTIMHDSCDYEKHPSGQNVVVAILSFDGYNMEDAILLNKASVERGFARSTYYRPVITEELRYSGGLIDEISVPDKDVKGYKTEKDYRLLEGDGIIYPEAVIAEGDVVIGKTSPPRFLSSLDEYNLTTSSRRESSMTIKHGEKGIVDFILLTENNEGNKLVQVRLRDQRIPEMGDKFTSRHGQKGVIGLIIDTEDMPYSASGIVPDIIFNPHGIPSRMTMSHLIELIGGKVGSLAGRYIDGTAFESEQHVDLRKELARMGFREDGTETFYNGRTGEMLKAQIFVGDMYYLKLKHMVSNKVHARARGPIQLLTRQPTEGRAKEGGLRLGEMEKDTFVSHGVASLLKERFDSDKVAVPVCIKSGLIGYYDKRKDRLVSPIYGEGAEMAYVEMSYAFKLLLDELKSFGIYPKLELEDKY